MDFEIPEEYRAVQQLARRFVEDELRPLEKVVEENEELPPETWERLRKRSNDLGLLAPFAPEEEGGGGMPFSYLAYILLAEVMGSTCVIFRGLVGHGGRRAASSELSAGEGAGGGWAAITEPDAGSDQRSMKTTAVKDGDEWVINGVKHLISGVTRKGNVATPGSQGIVYAITDKESRRVTPFLVKVGMPGFTVGRQQKLLGTRGVFVNELYFDDCRVPDNNRIGGEGLGLRHFLNLMALARLEIGAYGVGAAQYCLDRCIDYAVQRVTFGQPLAMRQAVQWMLCDSWMEIETTRWLVYRTAWGMDQDEDFRLGYSATKILGSELACRVADRAIQIHGGLGYTTDLPFERIWRDYRGAQIYEGATEIHKFIIARQLIEERTGFRIH